MRFAADLKGSFTLLLSSWTVLVRDTATNLRRPYLI